MASILRAVSYSSAAIQPSSTTTTPSYESYATSSYFLQLVKSYPGLVTLATIILSLLILEQAVYRSKKRGLPGDRWTIPLIGKFVDSAHPTLEGYQRQWDSGELSAVSVFNMYVRLPFIKASLRKLIASFHFPSIQSEHAIFCP